MVVAIVVVVTVEVSIVVVVVVIICVVVVVVVNICVVHQGGKLKFQGRDVCAGCIKLLIGLVELLSECTVCACQVEDGTAIGFGGSGKICQSIKRLLLEFFLICRVGRVKAST
jgi:hypothetical protein